MDSVVPKKKKLTRPLQQGDQSEAQSQQAGDLASTSPQPEQSSSPRPKHIIKDWASI